MPSAPLRPCPGPRCSNLVTSGRCRACARTQDREQLATRKFYWSRRWRACRAALLWRRPLCADCEANGRVTAAVEVHHTVAPHVDPDLAFADSNLTPLCKPHHSRRTMTAHNARRSDGR